MTAVAHVGWSRRSVTRLGSTYVQVCCFGWQDNGRGECVIPKCRTPCYNGGTCIAPDTCKCPPSHDGTNCATLLCSHKKPCFPGVCGYPENNCQCYKGWEGPTCLTFSTGQNLPTMLSCGVTLANIRRTDLKELFYFSIPCSNETASDIVWCNQQNFNFARFSIDSLYIPLHAYFPSEKYIHSSNFGIVHSEAHVLHTKVNKNGGPNRIVALDNKYNCTEISERRPSNNANCVMTENDYIYSLEHGDEFTVRFSTRSGGYRQLYDIDYNRISSLETYNGHVDAKSVEFKFDFIAPLHCSEQESHIRMPDLEQVMAMKEGDGGIYVTSAIKETGYMWQTSQNDTKTNLVFKWASHFVNKVHADGKLLNSILPYPTQFKALEDDGILRSKKYVSIDDNHGLRTLAAIPNKNGIIKFDVKRVYTDDKREPTSGWTEIPLTENYNFSEIIADGSHVRLWVRATDIMNNTLADYTEVHIDNSPPRVSNSEIQHNALNGSFPYTTRLTFDASDDGSGVHKIAVDLFVADYPNFKRTEIFQANRKNESGACASDPECRCILDTCFRLKQSVDIDNCWYLVPKEYLNSTGGIQVTVYNQALLTQAFNFSIKRLSILQGLEEYSGPTNIRVEENLASGVRLVWDLPDKPSCYGRVDIVLVINIGNGQIRKILVNSEENSVDVLGLDPDKEYSVSLNLGFHGTELAELPYSFRTAAQENHLDGGIIAGVVIAVLVLIGAMLAVFVLLLRRGYMQPVRRRLDAMTVRYRKSRFTRPRSHANLKERSYSNSMYIYGDMDFKDVDSWQLSRNDVVLESLLASGSFADIYLASVQNRRNQMIAKTLKQGYTSQDAFLMKAKINFYSMEVGEHENVISFVGAVTENTDMGPFILFEYCSKGQLNDHLSTLRSNVTVQVHEQLLHFCLQVARGMDFLAAKKIVHRRLAARNVLLDSNITAKISGFGPIAGDGVEDGIDRRRERIPIKWMAPECLKSTKDATDEKRYLVVWRGPLRDIFTGRSTIRRHSREGDTWSIKERLPSAKARAV
ncbi:uncharacterized protein LOC127876967 isoform X2 [Dreissena polymorpha]|uniref:uncharacterized protein LOC127876967 isoform X2 n=1 Tax=Dreissena polymorpha TaxID=45954 RepID=UPI002264A704|nr:uncharacterized protein LOC127876967 isoform X2 [Dreissena polymorpha]